METGRQWWLVSFVLVVFTKSFEFVKTWPTSYIPINYQVIISCVPISLGRSENLQYKVNIHGAEVSWIRREFHIKNFDVTWVIWAPKIWLSKWVLHSYCLHMTSWSFTNIFFAPTPLPGMGFTGLRGGVILVHTFRRVDGQTVCCKSRWLASWMKKWINMVLLCIFEEIHAER